MHPFEFADPESAKSILTKLGIDPKTRIDDFDQDIEYTSCRLEELELYIELYRSSDTTEKEKRVLGCYFLECLNESISEEGSIHSMFSHCMELLHDDKHIHEPEFDYWTTTEEEDEENSFPIKRYILIWRGSSNRG